MTHLQEIRSLCINKELTVVYTHGGKFHADDVFACAVASLLRPDNELRIIRCKNLEDLKRLGVDDSNSLIVDIGLGRFDHHQKQKEYYSDGVEKSAVAKLWDYIGEELIEEELLIREISPEITKQIFKTVTENLIKPISDTDTKGQKSRPNMISRMVLNRTNTDEDELDLVFYDVVYNAKDILFYEIMQAVSEAENVVKAKELAAQFRQEGHPGWGFTPEFIPASAFEGTEVRFVVGESARGGFNIDCVDSELYPIPETLDAPKKGSFWANYPEQGAAEKAAAWLDNLYRRYTSCKKK